METRTVKYNLKNFIESYVFLEESDDKIGKEELISEFNNYFYSCTDEVKNGIESFILSNKIARQYAGLQALANRCRMFKVA